MPFYRSKQFWESVLASVVAALLLYLLSLLLRPIGPLVTRMGWESFAAWFSNLGWFLFVMTLAVWWVNRRSQTNSRMSAVFSSEEAAATESVERTATGFSILQTYPDRSDNQKLVYPLKLFVELKNGMGDSVRLYNPRWIRAPDGWPKVPPSLVKLKEARGAKDADSIEIPNGREFIAWIAFDAKTISEDEIRRRRERRSLGALELTMQRAGVEEQVRVEL